MIYGRWYSCLCSSISTPAAGKQSRRQAELALAQQRLPWLELQMKQQSPLQHGSASSHRNRAATGKPQLTCSEVNPSPTGSAGLRPAHAVSRQDEQHHFPSCLSLPTFSFAATQGTGCKLTRTGFHFYWDTLYFKKKKKSEQDISIHNTLNSMVSPKLGKFWQMIPKPLLT